MNTVFVAIGVAAVVIILAGVIGNNFFHKQYAAIVSKGQQDVLNGQVAVRNAITQVQAAAADVKAAAAAISGAKP